MVTHVWFVEDDPWLQEFLPEAADILACEIEVMGSGREVLHRLEREPLPDVLVVDALMSPMSGRELVQLLRHEPRTATLPLVLWTADTRSRQCFEGWVQATLPKPCSLQTLKAVLHEVAGGLVRANVPLDTSTERGGPCEAW